MIAYGMLGAVFAHKMQEAKFRRGFSLFVAPSCCWSRF